MRRGVFVVIDEETTKTLLDAPATVSEIPGGSSYWAATERGHEIVIKVVNADYDEACEGIQFPAPRRGHRKMVQIRLLLPGHQDDPKVAKDSVD